MVNARPWSTSKGIQGPVGKQNEMGEAEPGSRWEAGWDKLKGQVFRNDNTHLSLAKDCPEPRRVQPPGPGTVIAFPQVGGLHHRYERLAA